MKDTENKYTYLTQYEIDQVKKENIEEILDRLNNKEQKYKRLFWETQHYGKVSILIYKNGAQIQSIHFDELHTGNGFMFNEIKGMAQSLEHIYQDYESLIETKIILSDTWDERDEPKKTEE
jgi:hypothetical protein